jgi:hypothetical protein
MDELDALLKEIQGGGLTREEWIKEGRAYYAENKSLKGWKNKTWVNPETGESFILTSKTRRGQTKPDDGSSYTPKSVKAQSKQGSNRKEREAVPERLRSEFNSDEEFQAFKDYVKKGNSQNQKLASQAGELGTDFNKGHIKSLAQGGSHDPADQRLESAEGNKSSISFEDPSDESLRATGQATNWDEAVQYYKEGRPENYFKLTPQDKQRIWKGEKPDVVISQRDAAIAKNPLARPAPQRFDRLGTRRATPGMVGAARALGKNLPSIFGTAISVGAGVFAAGQQAIAGDWKGAGNTVAQTGASELAGDLPLVGDMIEPQGASGDMGYLGQVQQFYDEKRGRIQSRIDRLRKRGRTLQAQQAEEELSEVPSGAINTP